MLVGCERAADSAMKKALIAHEIAHPAFSQGGQVGLSCFGTCTTGRGAVVELAPAYDPLSRIGPRCSLPPAFAGAQALACAPEWGARAKKRQVLPNVVSTRC